jgi:hypothetical protein
MTTRSPLEITVSRGKATSRILEPSIRPSLYLHRLSRSKTLVKNGSIVIQVMTQATAP